MDNADLALRFRYRRAVYLMLYKWFRLRILRCRHECCLLTAADALLNHGDDANL